MGWFYYIALGACVGTLVFMFVNGPGRHRPQAAPSPLPEAVQLAPPPTREPTGEPVVPSDNVAAPLPPVTAPGAAGSSPTPSVATSPTRSIQRPASTSIALPKSAQAPAPKPIKPAKAPESDIPSGI